ncbi:citrate-binding protein-like [Argentina anserina]|uniref:citrate-binding protein-like n=1 Tax=Argentina anserina TaxID=57926 RepID=UPI002176519E|nr:citrate-binding protein-like [Potentilla anserina]
MTTSTSTIFYKNALFLLLLSSAGYLCNAADPTDGFTRVSLTDKNFKLQKPYDKPAAERYSKIDGVETFKVYTSDKPFEEGSPTRPRTEIRISGLDYTSGVWQFEGIFYVPKGTTGVILMQVFGATTEATTLQLRVIDGNLMYYNKKVVVANVYNKWVKVNVIHNVGTQKVTIFVDGVQKLVMDGHGRDTHYFKYGAYAALTGSSNYMESRWKGIQVYKK